MDSGFRLGLNLTQKKHQAGEEQGPPARPAPHVLSPTSFPSAVSMALEAAVSFSKNAGAAPQGPAKTQRHLGQAEERRNGRRETQSGSH